MVTTCSDCFFPRRHSGHTRAVYLSQRLLVLSVHRKSPWEWHLRNPALPWCSKIAPNTNAREVCSVCGVAALRENSQLTSEMKCNLCNLYNHRNYEESFQPSHFPFWNWHALVSFKKHWCLGFTPEILIQVLGVPDFLKLPGDSHV